ncbi:Tetratricopeptide repeat-containing protein [Pricia antarctica]|uniref:Tetratricopeptide repeat-containing protein n=1 Tax=Pricia antarctica TaxID=641691 RepID=A0A1G7BBE1_9FLAO|nr:tetratricopeptide repeat protein [Pricia antarctica]SDE24120.1 Tetratricopeptide repeat-containing protein [Pricia antarctica]
MKTRKFWSTIHFFFLLTCFFLKAQETANVDSLLYLLKNTSQDSVKTDLYVELGKSLTSIDTTKAEDYFKKAQTLGKKINDEKRVCVARIELAHFYLYNGNIPKSLNLLGKVEKQLRNFHDSSVEADFYQNRGMAYNFNGEYYLAVEDQLKALALYEQVGDSTGLGRVYLNLGISNMDLNNNDKALEYYQKGFRLYRGMGDQKRMAHALGNIGLIYGRKKDYEKALQYHNQALRINEKYDLQYDARMDLNNIGIIYFAKGDYKTASEFHKKSKDIAESLGLPQYILSSEFNLALIDYKLKNYTQSINALNGLIKEAIKKNFKSYIRESYDLLSYAYEENGNFAKALDSRKNYEIYKDSLINENHLNQVAELQIKYEAEKKNQQIIVLNQEKNMQRKEAQRQATLKNAFIIGVLLIALLAGLLYYTLHQRLKSQKVLASKNEEIKEVNFKRQLTELEMKALQAQINPHFIFNCMNSINQMILDGDNKNASKYLTKFGKLIRMVLENAESTEVSLKDELSLLEAYIQLESLRFNGEIQHNIDIKGDIDLENTYLPSMVLQPFVENAIWHGLMHRKDIGNGKITISIEQQGDQLVCEIEDNGVGRQKAFELQQRSVYKSKSLGLKITEERLRLLSKELQRKLIHITDLTNQAGEALGTRVTVNIPIS